MANLINTKWQLIDNNRNISISENTDPFLQGDFDSYVQISERINPGRRPVFNELRNIATVNLEVTALTMDFKANINASRLSSLLGRSNVENLYLYADTIIIKRRLHFPQTNVHIFARRLMIEDKGEISTTPNLIDGGLAATGGEQDNMTTGSSGQQAGNIYLHVDELSSNRDSNELLEETIHIPNHLFRTLKKDNTSNRWPTVRMFPQGSSLDFEFTGDHFQSFQIILEDQFPTEIIGAFPSHFHGINIQHNPELGFNIQISTIGYKDATALTWIKKDIPTIIRIIYEKGKIIVHGGVKQNELKQILILDKLEGLETVKYIGFRNYNASDDFIKSAQISSKRNIPLFSLNGQPGQNGQPGNHHDPAEASRPITEDMIWDEVLHFSAFGNRDRKFWFRPLMNYTRNSDVLYAEINVYSVYGKEKVKQKIDPLGDPLATNPNSGLDAYASGDGGNSGNGGIVQCNKALFDLQEIDCIPGPIGISKMVKGKKVTANTTNYQIAYKFVLNDRDSVRLSGFSKDSLKHGTQEIVLKTLRSIPGKDAVGMNGSLGNMGQIKLLKDQAFSWIHPFLLERVVQFTKDEFMRGNRQSVQWIIDIYQKSLSNVSFSSNNQDFQMADLQNEIRVMSNRLNGRLDYFGNPVGWIPRLSTVDNISLLKLIKSNTVSLIFKSNAMLEKSMTDTQIRKNLDFAINQLNKDVAAARKRLDKAHQELNSVKDDLNEVTGQIRTVNNGILNLHDKIMADIQLKDHQQLMYTTTIKLFSGLAHLIPVGQPILGEIGSTILNAVADIDIHAEDPFMESFGVIDNLSAGLGDFITKNKKELEASTNSDLDKRIEANKSNIDDTQALATSYKTNLDKLKPTFESAFDSADFKVLEKKLNAAKTIDSFKQLEFYQSEDYEVLLNNINELETEIKDLNHLSEAEKKSIKTKISTTKAELKTLKTEKKTLENSRKERTNALEKAGEATRRIGKGISGVSASLQQMMVQFDPEDPAVKASMEKALTGKYKDEFSTLNIELDNLNDKKWKAVNRFIKWEQTIDSTTGNIMNMLVQMATLSDQRAQNSAHMLTASARLYLQRVMESSSAFLLEQVDNLIKSYQYRFLRKVDSNFYSVQQLVSDLLEFDSEYGDIPDRDKFVDAYDFAFRSQFNNLAKDLLTELQKSALPNTGKHILTIDENTTFQNGRSILNTFNQLGQVSFRLHEIDGGQAKGSPTYFNYRISGMKFLDINVETDVSDLSFQFGIEHSGVSVIRNYRDKQYYYFTTRHGIESREANASYTHHWNADYNHAAVGPENNGLTNSVKVNTDEEVLANLLSDIDSNAKIGYSEHLPAATSVLTLHKHKIEGTTTSPFIVRKLQIQIDYEYKNK